MIPDLLRMDEFADAMDAAMRGSEAMVAVKELAEKQRAAVPHDTPLESLVSQLSQEGRRLVDRFVIVSGVVPAFLRIGWIAASNRESARAFALETATLCRQSADTGEDKEFYVGSARILEGFANDANPEQLYRLADSYDDSRYRELRVLAYLAGTLSADPQTAFNAQLAAMEVVFSWYPSDSMIHAKLLVPFIEAFWTTAFRERRFQFRSPSLVEQELATATTVDWSRRVRAILRAVRPAFRVAGIGAALSWLGRDN